MDLIQDLDRDLEETKRLRLQESNEISYDNEDYWDDLEDYYQDEVKRYVRNLRRQSEQQNHGSQATLSA